MKTTSLQLKIPIGLIECMDLLINEGLYSDREEIVKDAIRRLLELQIERFIPPYKYYWEKLKLEESIDIEEEKIDKLVHEVREELIK